MLVQLIPVGADVTVPVPVPAPNTFNANCCTDAWKVAVTERAAVMLTTQLPVPTQSLLQLLKAEPATGVAVSVTDTPLL